MHTYNITYRIKNMLSDARSLSCLQLDVAIWNIDLYKEVAQENYVSCLVAEWIELPSWKKLPNNILLYFSSLFMECIHFILSLCLYDTDMSFHISLTWQLILMLL